MVEPEAGWAWFQTAEPGPLEDGGPFASEAELAALAARCFRGKDGDRLLDHLRALTLKRALGPRSSDEELRHLEGQRQLVARLCALVRRGLENGAA